MVGRSFPPLGEPLAVRFEYPLWRPAGDLDPRRLRGLDRKQERQANRDEQPLRDIVAALEIEPNQTRNQVCKVLGGCNKERATRLLGILEAGGKIAGREETIQGGRATVYSLA